MSVSLNEVLLAAGYDVKNNPDDAEWFMSQEGEFNELFSVADRLIEEYHNYLDCKETAEEDGDHSFPSFKEWREVK